MANFASSADKESKESKAEGSKVIVPAAQSILRAKPLEKTIEFAKRNNQIRIDFVKQGKRFEDTFKERIL